MENEGNIAISEATKESPIATTKEPPVPALVPDEKLLGMYQDVLANAKSDRDEISDILSKFLDMVVNDGDASSASKEAVVNLVKAKSDANHQLIEIAKLMTNIKLKDKSTIDPAVNRAIHAQQNNIYIKPDETTNILLEEIEKASGRMRRSR